MNWLLFSSKVWVSVVLSDQSKASAGAGKSPTHAASTRPTCFKPQPRPLQR